MLTFALKTLDPTAVIEKGLQFNAYYMFFDDCLNQTHAFKCLEECGFDTLPHQSYVATTLDEIMWAIENVKSQREQYEMQIDGVVLKVNDVDQWSVLGNTDKFHKFGIAFKFTHELIKSPLKFIDWQLSQEGSGRLSPVAVYDTVEMCGTQCHRVTLNNIDYINKHYPDIHIGDYLMLTKGGDIIPRNDGFEVNPEHDTDMRWGAAQSEKSNVGKVMRQTSGKVVEPTYCPVCGATLIKNGAYIECPNKCVGHNKEVKPKAQLKVETPITQTSDKLEGMQFYVTGIFYDSNFKHSPQRRKDLQRMVSENGGQLQDKFNAKYCDYLVCGANVGQNKVDGMIKNGKVNQVISEDEFLKMI